jgi:hypothetical protein
VTLELAIVVYLIDLGAKDEHSTCQENHVVKVCRALDRGVTESRYLVCQLSMFDDRQLAMGVLRAMFRGLQCTKNLLVKQRDKQLILVRALFRVTAFMSSRRVAFCIGLMV